MSLKNIHTCVHEMLCYFTETKAETNYTCIVRFVKTLKHSPPCCLPTITVIKRRQALLGVSNMCDNGARNICVRQTKNAIVHVADACICAQPNMSPTQEKPLFSTMSDINQIVPATGAS